jgi:hypothetical protein
LRECAEHVVAGPRTPRFARFTAGADQLTGAQLHNQIVNVSAGQVLDDERAEFALYWLQYKLLARCRRRPDHVAGTQPVDARLIDCECRRLHRCSAGDLSLDLGKCGTRFLLGSVAATQLFSPAVDDAGVDRQLIPDDRLVTGTLGKLDASDLRRKAAFSHLCMAMTPLRCERR